MAARRDQQTKATSRLARKRVERGLTRHELARRVGISEESLKRLEYEQRPNAPLWWYRNLAIALRVPIDDILDERELRWRKTDMAPEPPSPDWLDAAREPARPSPAQRLRRGALAATD